ncbi:hypothetical protein SCHPADRAFT_762338 [Schizopora paradoxa]|uniref:WD40 repeat-like protein n=1 Tax=Schizopora paradoxa TaxID=27342 RepID=A0A0H2R3L6_9AGAM|nr:hypothetical protein SCHPADRAFT_762338 [Schizopora paradoxa]
MIETPHPSAATARSITFYDEGCSILVGYLENREISCFSIEPWCLKWTRETSNRIGGSALCTSDGASIFISNLADGVDQYRLPEMEKVKTFPHAIKSNFPLQVTVARGGSWLISGGDNGYARLFDCHSGRLLESLIHGTGAWFRGEVSRKY